MTGLDQAINERETRATRARFNRTALVYDLMDAMISERLRRLVASQAKGDVLELGVGTGKNLGLYPPGCRVTGIDISPRMLARARARVSEASAPVRLIEMDAQRLQFADASFDTVLATFVFCSIPDPVLGLIEAGRVCRPGGQILLLEHVRSDRPRLGRLMDRLDPLMVRIVGDHINRRTVDNVRTAGLTVKSVTDVSGHIVKLIEAARPSQ